MKRLNTLPINPTYVDRYIAIRDRKHNPVRQTLLDNHAAIAARYHALEDSFGQNRMEVIGQSPLLAVGDSLRACYTGKTKNLVSLELDIKNCQTKGQLKYCPYCGTTRGETLDHYLPASAFPEFSVHPLNLVPCCHRCNSIKGDDWLDAVNARQFINFYLDSVPTVQFLSVEMIERNGFTAPGASFYMAQNGIDDVEWRRITCHFNRLHLLDRYHENVNDEIAEVLSLASSIMEETRSPDSVRAILLRQTISTEELFGRNHWRAVLFRAISSHQDLQIWVDAAA